MQLKRHEISVYELFCYQGFCGFIALSFKQMQCIYKDNALKVFFYKKTYIKEGFYGY